MDAPCEREGPTAEEVKKEYMNALTSLEYDMEDPYDIIEICVDEWMLENSYGGQCPFGSDRGFYMGLSGDIKKIKKMIQKRMA